MSKKNRFQHCDHKQTLGGKGDLQRPSDKDKFESGWDRIFGNKDKKTEEKSQ